MGQPRKPAVPLAVLGSVPFRPIGSSHYVPVPGQLTGQTPYVPAEMSELALSKGLLKVTLPVLDFPVEYEVMLEEYFEFRLAPLWSGSEVISYEEAVKLLTFDKSPGYPEYYTCEDKECALKCYGGEIMQDVLAMLYGAVQWLPFNITLKDELRTADRVAQHKTRVFAASSLRHLLLAKMLFTDQENRLRKTLGQHPVTIGISVPGPGYVSALRSLSRNNPNARCWGFDIGGCDQCFLLAIARKIRDVRKRSLKPEFGSAVNFYYDSTYAGEAICCGCIHRLLHQKSGQELTGDDTSLYGWGLVSLYVMVRCDCSAQEADKYFKLLQNGDDGAVAFFDERLSGPDFRDFCAGLGVTIELEREEASVVGGVTFLSNTLRERFIPGLGDIVVTAGNLSKLLSSLEWLRRNVEFTLEENTLVHWCGLRIGLWPWKQHFDDLEERIDEYLKKIEITPRIVELLRCRVSSDRILSLHLRYEGGFSIFTSEEFNGVRSQFMSAIKLIAGMQLTKAEKIRRAAQSARDKQSAKKSGKNVTPKQNQGRSGARAHATTVGPVIRETTVSAPAAVGARTTSTFRVSASTRYKDGIMVEATDHIDFVAQPNPAAVTGQTLLEFYVSPASLGGSRLEKYGSLYEKFLFDVMDFELIPAVGSTKSGDLGLSYDPDVMDPTPPPTVDGVRQFTGYQFNCDANVWVRQNLSVKPTAPETGYFTNPVTNGPTDDRLSYQGQLYVYMAVPSDAAVDTVLARLRMKYRCHFFSPQLQDLNSGAQLVANFPSVLNSGTDNLMRVLQIFGAVVTGNPQYQVKLDSLAQGFMELAQGVYKVTGGFNAPGGDAVIQAPGMASDPSVMGTPTIALNAEPASAAAPQPWTAKVLENAEYGAASDVWNSMTSSYFLGIPRDGAKVMWPFEVPADVNNLDPFTAQLDIERIGNFVPGFSGLFLGLWKGSAECRRPKEFRVEALARATAKWSGHPALVSHQARKTRSRTTPVQVAEAAIAQALVQADVASVQITPEAARRFPLASAAIAQARAREEARLTAPTGL